MALGIVDRDSEWENRFWYRYTREGLAFDWTRRSHPIINKMNSNGFDLRRADNNVKDYLAQFDRISYHKAASVLQMIRSLIGNTKFQQFMQEILVKHKFQSISRCARILSRVI